jgi:hypothetical protein
MPSRCFIPARPSTRDPVTGEVTLLYDISPLAIHGEAITLLPTQANPTRDAIGCAERLARAMEDACFGPSDWVVCLGSPVLVAMASVVAIRRTGQLRLLQWSGRNQNYLPVVVQGAALDVPTAVS